MMHNLTGRSVMILPEYADNVCAYNPGARAVKAGIYEIVGATQSDGRIELWIDDAGAVVVVRADGRSARLLPLHRHDWPAEALAAIGMRLNGACLESVPSSEAHAQ